MRCKVFGWILLLTISLSSGQFYIPSTPFTTRDIAHNFLRLGWHSVKGGKFDLVFIIDRSGSVKSHGFAASKTFIRGLLDHFSISSRTTRVAVVSYATRAKTEFGFDSHFNRDSLYKSIGKMRHSGGRTATGDALANAISIFRRSSRKGQPKRRKVVFLLTDGKTNTGKNPVKMARVLKRMGTTIYTLGVTRNVAICELRSIASNLKSFYLVRRFSNLRSIIRHLRYSSFLNCRKKKWRRDACNRVCYCHRGKLTKCYRIRKEFTAMSISERKRYIKAVLTLTTKQPYKAKFIGLVRSHSRHFADGIHERDQFLPWHRWFMQEYENLLREVDCRVTIPYWDWSMRSHAAWTISNPVWHNNYGFGGNGQLPQRCVRSGPFRMPSWKLSTGQCLSREFMGQPPDAPTVKAVQRIRSFYDFELLLRVSLHNTVHCLIGGTMCGIDSAEAPEFFLHHGFIDKIWADWQKRSSLNLKAHFYYIRTPMAGTLNGHRYTPRDFVDLNKQPQSVRVKYLEPGVKGAVMARKFLNRLSSPQLSALQRRPFNAFNYKSGRLFEVSRKEWARAHTLMAKLTTGVSSHMKRPRSKLERRLGFHIKG